MSKKQTSVGVEFTGDPSGFKRATEEVNRSLGETKKHFADAEGIFGAMGDAIGGVVGQVGSLATSITSAVGPAGILVAVIGGIAEAWKKGKEAVDEYLKSADKVALGSIGFNQDTREARKDTRKRMAGGMLQAQTEYNNSVNRLAQVQENYFRTNDPTEKEKLKNEVLFLDQQAKEAKAAWELTKANLATITGFKDKVAWEQKYNGLLLEEEKLNDKRLELAEQWEALEADLAAQRVIAIDKESTAAQRKQAGLKAEEIAGQLLKSKNEQLNAELTNLTAISEMTYTQEAVEDRVAAIKREIRTNEKEYQTDLRKSLMIQNKGTAAAKEQAAAERQKLADLKEYNTHNAAGYKIEDAKTDNLKYNAPKWAVAGSEKLKPYIFSPETIKQAKDALKVNTEYYQSLEDIQQAGYEMEGIFYDMFSSIKDGWKGMINALISDLERLVMQVIAKKASLAIINALSTQAGWTGGELPWTQGDYIPQFASGTNFAPGGLSIVGERGPELVNLPRGSQVIPGIGKQSQVLEAVIKGSDIYLSNQRYAQTLNRNT